MEMINKGALDIKGLMEYCSVGKNTAYKIGEDAGAVIRIGKRKLFNVRKVQEYLDRMTDSKESMEGKKHE